MKIERVNDRQIRCTLTGADLANRQLKISELAYGSEKAKILFRDMMQQAEFECGFEADDIPLVIEAIPVSSDCIILIITKVEDPEELDTRFSRFAPSVSDSDDDEDGGTSLGIGEGGNGLNEFAEGMINLLREVKASIERRGANLTGTGAPAAKEEEKQSAPAQLCCLLVSKDLSTLSSFARSIASYYEEPSTLFRDPEAGYALLLTSGKLNQEEFARICNVATEFGSFDSVSDSRLAYIREHCEVILEGNAIKGLSSL